MAKTYANTMQVRAGIVRVVDDDNQVVSEYQGIMPAFRKVSYSDNRDYVVQVGDTWQGISLTLLGDATLWWVIAEWNRVLDPFTELYPGRRLVIPAQARVSLATLADL